MNPEGSQQATRLSNLNALDAAKNHSTKKYNINYRKIKKTSPLNFILSI